MSEKPEDHFGQPINVGDNVMMRSGRKNKMRKGKVEEVVLTDEQAKKRDLDHAPQIIYANKHAEKEAQDPWKLTHPPK